MSCRVRAARSHGQVARTSSLGYSSVGRSALASDARETLFVSTLCVSVSLYLGSLFSLSNTAASPRCFRVGVVPRWVGSGLRCPRGMRPGRGRDFGHLW